MIRVACIFLAASVFAASVRANERADEAERRMFPDGMSHDFGKVQRGTIAKHSFRIVNSNTAPMEIVEMRFMCPGNRFFCRSIKKVLKPGELGTIDTEIHTEKFRGSAGTSLLVTTALRGVLQTHHLWVGVFSEERPVAGNMEALTPPHGRSYNETTTAGISPRVPTEEAERRMFPDGMSHDFGKVPCGSVHECWFRFVNTHSHEMEITNVRPGMGLGFSASTNKYRLKPGETAIIKVGHDTKYQDGVRSRAIFVTYEVGGRPEESRFLVQSSSDKSMSPDGNTHHFGTIVKGALLKRSFRFVNNRDEPMSLYKLLSDDGLSINVDKQRLQKNEVATIELQLESSKIANEASRTAMVFVEGGDKRYRIPFTLFANSLDERTFLHQRMFPDGTSYSFAFDDATPAYKRSFRIVNEGRAAIKIVDVHGKPGPLSVMFSAKTIGPGQTGTFELTVTNSRLIDAQTFTSTVTLEIAGERRVVDLTATAVRTPMPPQPVLPAPRPSRDPF